MANKKILILADDRIGTYSQAVGLAQASNLEYEIIFLEYNFLKILPNFLFSSSLLRLKKTSKEKILNYSQAFDYIISAGRKSATISLFIKNFWYKKFNFNCKIVQIMRPEINFKKFDHVILPFHDKINNNFTNIIKSFGALNKFDINDLNPNFNNLNYPQPIIAILIGGDSKGKKFSLKMAQKMVNKSQELTKNLNGTIVILNSRRTSVEINNYLNTIKNNKIIFFDYNLHKNNNPYKNIIVNSKIIIISGDSVSMISDCCQLGKAIYIFDDPKICSKKHSRFHNELYKQQYASPLDNLTQESINKNHKILDEANRISKLIF